MGNLPSRLFLGGLCDYIQMMHWATPVIHLVWVLAFAYLFWQQNRARRVFAAVSATGYLFFAIMPFVWIVWRLYAQTGGVLYTQDLQALQVLARRCTGGAVICLALAVLWLIETIRPRNDYTFNDVPQWRWWVMPFFLWALMWPLSPAFPYHREVGFDGVLFSPFGIMPGATSLAILALLAVCRDAGRILATGTGLLVLLLVRFVEPQWWASIPVYVLAAYCAAFWNLSVWCERRTARARDQAEPE